MADSVETPTTDISPYLKQVRIRDYPPLRDAEVNFKPGLNIIIGSNGAGKTRFLTLTSQLIIPFGTPDTGNECEIVFGYEHDINIRFQQVLTNVSNTINSSLYDLEIETEIKTELYYNGKSVIGDDLLDAFWLADLKEVTIPDTVLARHGTPLHQLPLSDIPATLTFRIASGKISSELESEGFTYNNRPLLISSIFSTIGYAFARNRRYQRINKIPFSLTVEEARNEVEKIINGYLDFLNPYIQQYSPVSKVRLGNTYQVYDNNVQQEVVFKGLIFEYYLNKTWLPFSALSDGTKRMLYLITQLVMPVARFNERMQLPVSFTLITSPRIIFLEEPELGIHHSQLHKLLYLIREVSREHQVILTTHAPQVLDMLSADELDRITICSLDPEKGTQFHKLTEEKQEQARVYIKEVGFLSDYWRYSYLEETEAE